MNTIVFGACEVTGGVSVSTMGRLKTAIAQGKALLSAWRLSDKKIMLRHGEIDAGCGCGCQPAE
jgi:hypothetical protein